MILRVRPYVSRALGAYVNRLYSCAALRVCLMPTLNLRVIARLCNSTHSDSGSYHRGYFGATYMWAFVDMWYESWSNLHDDLHKSRHIQSE